MWLAFLSTVGSPWKSFFCTESTIWNPSAAHRFKEKNSSTLPKNWSICIPPLNSLQNMPFQAEIDIIFNSQIIRHICGWIYKDFCRHLLIRDWCRTEIVLKVKDWIWLWLTSRNGDLWLFFLNWNTVLRHIFVHMIFVASVFETIYFMFKGYYMGETYNTRKPYKCRIQWAYFNVLISNFYLYKKSNEIKLSILLCTKKVRQIFVHVCSRIAIQADDAK